ncbi:MAG: nucleoside hydrolase [Mobilitalea sp.]
MNQQIRLRRLTKPSGKIDVVIDTDTYNEIDDQFALAYLIKLQDKLNLQAIYAAPFFNERSSGPKEGMERSYEEILRILEIMEKEEYGKVTYRGSDTYLTDERTPVESPAARDLIQRAMSREEDSPLYVVAIGAITNVASAILLEPKLVDRIVLVWLGGNGHHWTDNKEFNLMQDVAAARIIFECGVPLIQLPCGGVVSEFRTTGPELEYWLRGKNKLCDYLIDATIKEGKRMGVPTWSRVIWDVTAVAWLLEGDFMYDSLEPSPIPEYNDTYRFDSSRPLIRYVYGINRDRLFEHLFETLSKE